MNLLIRKIPILRCALFVIYSIYTPVTMAAALHNSSMVVEMQFLDTPSREIFVFSDLFSDDQKIISDTGFPSFVVHSSSASWNPETFTLSFEMGSVARGVYSGGISANPAIASGIIRQATTIGITNPNSRVGFMLDVRVTARFLRQLERDDLVSDYAESIIAFSLAGNLLDGVPDGNLFNQNISTADGEIYVVDPSLDEIYHIWFPPSIDANGNSTQYSLGVFGQVGGAAASRTIDDGIFILSDTPETISYDEFSSVVPLPNAFLLFMSGVGYLFFIKKKQKSHLA